MKKVEIGTGEFTEVYAMGKPGADGGYYSYLIALNERSHLDTEVFFQRGPIKEVGINGCHNEDLLAIVMHRLQCFQEGPFACDENAQALESIKIAMAFLNARTADRKARNVEGTNQI